MLFCLITVYSLVAYQEDPPHHFLVGGGGGVTPCTGAVYVT